MRSDTSVVVTGGSRGIGLEVARIFLEHGADVLVVSRSPQKLLDAKGELPALQTLAVDVSRPMEVDQLTQWVNAHWGRLDVLVNNAGIFPDKGLDLLSLSDELLQTTIEVNVFGAFYCTKRLLPLLMKSPEPRIINIGSTSGIMNESMDAIYGVSKAALHALTIAFANGLRGKAAVNVVSPGWVKTDMAPDGPGDPRTSAETVLRVAEQPFGVTGRFFGGSGEMAWAS